jgi:hypothetical protein
MRSLKNPTEAQRLAIKEKYKDVEHRLGEFAAEVGEEELTTQSYRLPGSNQYVTASVFYTEEMMASRNTFDSMVVGIIVSPTRHDKPCWRKIALKARSAILRPTTRSRSRPGSVWMAASWSWAWNASRIARSSFPSPTFLKADHRVNSYATLAG